MAPAQSKLSGSKRKQPEPRSPWLEKLWNDAKKNKQDLQFDIENEVETLWYLVSTAGAGDGVSAVVSAYACADNVDMAEFSHGCFLSAAAGQA